MKRSLFVTLVVAAFLSVGTRASADIIFTLNNVPGTYDFENILFKAGDQGKQITGYVGQSTLQVLFSTLTDQELKQDAKGQASIYNSTGAYLTSMQVSVPGSTFAGFIMNPMKGSGTARVQALDNFGAIFYYDFGPGENFLTITAVNGQSIRAISLTMMDCVESPCGFTDFKQPRIAMTAPVPPIPEPASMLLLGTGLVGVATYLRRRR